MHLLCPPPHRYREIAGSHPDNVECLRYLVHLCQELGRADDCDKYMDMLRRAERSQVRVEYIGAMHDALCGVLVYWTVIMCCCKLWRQLACLEVLWHISLP